MSVVEIVANIIGYGLELLVLFVKCLFIYAAYQLIKGFFTGNTRPFDQEDWKRYHKNDVTDPTNVIDYDIYMRF
ncbi:Uncharacterized protein dnl_07030 [Desulfonema limicola]|uniref:Uncharacterized protein n=1 Tax=Desulfonema limicola TaxID=45656 RepID=A0A975B480_9BACT|nr:hypothetical protein [Desulfonema limicola]QTA78481.1 Uncharacterized protein dnl_07030 [Desulfonema limicola]